MPRRDRDRLEYLFRKLILQDDFGYTLLGRKPLSIASYMKPCSLKEPLIFFDSILPSNLRLKWGWQTWEKYQHLFNNPYLALWSEKSPWIECAHVILLINKQSAQLLLDKQQTDFQKVLQTEYISLDDLIDQLPLLSKGLNKHEALIGMLLGYGRNNAWLFNRGQNFGSQYSLWDEQTQVKEVLKLQYFGKKDIASTLMYPSFVADPESEETKLLREEYLTVWQEIVDYYKDKDFLEATLGLLL